MCSWLTNPVLIIAYSIKVCSNFENSEFLNAGISESSTNPTIFF